MNIREILRTGHVTRWHIVRTHRQQTIAEHMYLVTMFALKMWEAMGMPPQFGTTLLMEWCLKHDWPEVYTGDIPTPMKKALGERAHAIEKESDHEYRQLELQVRNHSKEWILFKIADLAESLLFLRTEGIGTHARAVMDELERTLRERISEAGRIHPNYSWQNCWIVVMSAESAPVRQLSVSSPEDAPITDFDRTGVTE